MGYISTKENFTGRFYDDGAILRLSQSALERQYQDMLLALQPLAVLPFQVEYETVAGYSLADSSYMGESDIEPNSPKKQELSSSPKIVIARAKTGAGTSPNRASWAGPTDRQDSSFTKSDRMDFSATWDWIKTTTLPKARSLMSDMGLLSSTTSVGSTAGSTAGSAPPSSSGVKISRLSQDLASVGIVSSRQNLSVTGSSSTPNLSQNCSMTVDMPKEEKDEETRPASFPGERHQQALPAVVVDHGTMRMVENNSARLRAEEILRRKSETSPQRGQSQGSPVKAETSEKKEVTDRTNKGSPVPTKHDEETRNDLQGNLASSPQKIVASSPQRRSESSPIQIHNSPTRQSGSPNRHSGSPSRQSGSPSRQSGSPNRQSGSPNRGPLINPGSPKFTIAGARGSECVEVISRRVAKVALDDFPEDDNDGDNSKTSNSVAVQSPLTTVSSAAEKLLPKKEEKVYREGKTDYAFDATASSQCQNTQPTASATTSPTGQAAQPQNPNSNQTSGRSRLSGLRRLSPKGSFNIISFFDRLLLPSEKAAANSSTATAAKVPSIKENPASEWDSTDQGSSTATGTSSTASSSAPSPTPPESVQTSSSTSANSSPRAKQSKPPSKGTQGRGSRIPKRQTESQVARNAENNSLRKGTCKAAEKKTALSNSTRRSGRSQTPESIPITTTTSQRTDQNETPEVDINANSPEFHPIDAEEMFVEHNPIRQWGDSSSETGQSDASGQSVSMEEDQSRCVLQAKSSRGVPLKVPAFK